MKSKKFRQDGATCVKNMVLTNQEGEDIIRQGVSSSRQQRGHDGNNEEAIE